jgi:uncharacterized protein
MAGGAPAFEVPARKAAMKASIALVAVLLAPSPGLAQGGPAYDCSKKLTSSVEQRICKDAKLAALDRQLADVYAAAEAKATQADKQALAGAEKDWIKTRNDCWKASNVPACVQNAYRDRISELQARYALLNPVGTGHYLCPGPPAQEAVAQFYQTDPPTAMVHYAGATQFMRVARSGSGARYTGGKRQFWEHQGIAMIKWSATAPEVSCPSK